MLNPGKFQFMFLSKTAVDYSIEILQKDKFIRVSKIARITTDNKLKMQWWWPCQQEGGQSYVFDKRQFRAFLPVVSYILPIIIFIQIHEPCNLFEHFCLLV